MKTLRATVRFDVVTDMRQRQLEREIAEWLEKNLPSKLRPSTGVSVIAHENALIQERAA